MTKKKHRNKWLEELQQPIDIEYNSSSPFSREHIRRLLVEFRGRLFKVLSEVLLTGSGGLDHLWLYWSVLYKHQNGRFYPSYFMVLSCARWYLRQGKDVLKFQDFNIVGLSTHQIKLWLSRGVEDRYIRKKSRQGYYEITQRGVYYVDKMHREMFNAVANLYMPIPDKEKPASD